MGHMQISLQSCSNIHYEQETKLPFLLRRKHEQKASWRKLETLTMLLFDSILVYSFSVTDNHLAGNHGEHLISIPSPPPLVTQQAGMHSPPPRRASLREFSGTYESLPARSVQVNVHIIAIANSNKFLFMVFAFYLET